MNKVKLIKIDRQYKLFRVIGNDGTMLSINEKLSIKNCQAIERGYDLDELAYEKSWNEDSEKGFINGAKAILEILGDKKFSEEDVKKIIHWSTLDEDVRLSEEEFFQSLQQTEWYVIVQMEEIIYPANMPKEGENRPSHRPKLDSDGCLILKRKQNV